MLKSLHFVDNPDLLQNKSVCPTKITIVGVGQVGMACAFSILSSGLCSELVLADVERDKLTGEVMDLIHAGAFVHSKITAAAPNYEGTENSTICIITAGVRQRVNEDRRQLLERNVKVFNAIIPPLVRLSPNTIILVVSNPCDSLTYVAWKLSGLPKSQVFGSGTFLDSSRFRVILAEKLNVNPQSVHGWILGEHGDSSFPVLSGVNVSGILLHDIMKDDWESIHKQVTSSAYEVIKLKGYTNWAIGVAVSRIVEFIFKDSRHVIPLSISAKGMYGIDSEVFLSLPCIIGRRGIVQVLDATLTEVEKAKFINSATILSKLLVTLSSL